MHRAELLVATRAAVLASAGCATGDDAELARETPEVAGVGGAEGQVVLDDVSLESADGVLTGETVTLRAALSNDTITRPVRMQLTDAGLSVPADGSLPVTFVCAHAGEVRLDVSVAPGTAPGQASAR